MRAALSHNELLLVDSFFYLFVESLDGNEVYNIVDDRHYDYHKSKNIDFICKSFYVDSFFI